MPLIPVLRWTWQRCSRSGARDVVERGGVDRRGRHDRAGHPACAHHLHQLIQLADPQLGEVGALGLGQRADHPDGFEPELWMIRDDRADLRGLIVDAHDHDGPGEPPCPASGREPRAVDGAGHGEANEREGADGEDPCGHDLDPSDAVDCRCTCGQHRGDPGQTGLLDRSHRGHPSEVQALLRDEPAPRGHERHQAHQHEDADGGRRRRPEELGNRPRHCERDEVRSPQRASQEGRTRSRDAVCVANLIIGGPSDQRTVLLMPDPSRQPLVANDNAHARPPPSLDVLVAPV